MARADKRAHHRVTFAVLAAGVGGFAILQSLVIPVLTTVQVQFHTTANAATWVLTAYLVSASVFTPIMGRIGDMIGKPGREAELNRVPEMPKRPRVACGKGPVSSRRDRKG